jgi:hypothetical protein
MFNDKFCLTQAVLNGTKTMTRRVLKVPKTCNGKEVYSFNILTNSLGTQCVDLIDYGGNVLGSWKPHYEVGEVVAIAQSYKEVYPNADFEMVGNGFMTESAGWNNKMFVRADLMPHHIKITEVKMERLQDISGKECLREGVKRASIGFYAEGVKVKDCEKEAHRETASGCLKLFPFPRQAFASLIDKISGKGTWESNPFVVAYSFELID